MCNSACKSGLDTAGRILQRLTLGGAVAVPRCCGYRVIATESSGAAAESEKPDSEQCYDERECSSGDG